MSKQEEIVPGVRPDHGLLCSFCGVGPDNTQVIMADHGCAAICSGCIRQCVETLGLILAVEPAGVYGALVAQSTPSMPPPEDKHLDPQTLKEMLVRAGAWTEQVVEVGQPAPEEPPTP